MSTAMIVMLAGIIVTGFLSYVFIKNPAKNKKTRKMRIQLIAALLLLVVVCGLIAFGPRGYNALWSKKGAGENKGSGTTENYARPSKDEATDMPVISVTGKMITVGDQTYSENEYEQFAAYAAEHAAAWESIQVIDSYASAQAYHYVIDTLNLYHISYVEVKM